MELIVAVTFVNYGEMGLINPPQAMIEEDPIFGVLSTH
jgi:hypothetical protein